MASVKGRMMEEGEGVFEFFDDAPVLDVLDSEYARLLGYPIGRSLQDRSLEIAEQTREWYAKNGSPWIYARQVSQMDLLDSGVSLDGTEFSSAHLKRTLLSSEANSAFLVAVSAGPECVEQAAKLWKEGKPDEYFFLEVFGGAVVEHLVTQAGARLCAWADAKGKAVLPHYSPGYPEWDVAQQNELHRLVTTVGARSFSTRLGVLESGMLTPKKSLLAVFGVTDAVEKTQRLGTLSACESCSLAGCGFRRKPYYLDTMKDLANEQRKVSAGSEGDKLVALDTAATYSISPRALRKWAESRLELVPASDGGFEAVFTYDGTTCSNMGHPLRYLYRVSLGNRKTGYMILDASCEAAEGDEGHKLQCEYLKDGDKLNVAIENERPLVGEPLDAVLHWKHPSSSAGCFCDESSRNHKWTIAYEVLHYALANKEKERAG